MNPVVVGIVVFACSLGGVLVGMWLSTLLPEHHLNKKSEDAVKLGIGLIATMTALVLSLVTASAKSSFDALDAAVKQTASDILTLDRVLARYGAETGEIRGELQKAITHRIDLVWPPESLRSAQRDPSTTSSGVEIIVHRIRTLTPANDIQRSLQLRAIELSEALLQTRWLVFAGSGTSILLPFLVVLTFWLTITFASFGLFAPRNATVFSVLFVCAVSVGSAAFLILEMDGPFDGVLRVSAEPLRNAAARLNQ